MLLNLDKNWINGLILSDFQEVFDIVDHQILIEKLHIYGLDKDSLALIRSYLHQRKQRTVIGSLQIVLVPVPHRPQGAEESNLM